MASPSMTIHIDLATLRCEHRVTIAAASDELYDYIADMPRVGEISRQCTGGVWEGDERGIGAAFIGSNTMGERSWRARMRVTVAE
jgi:hypothetical protein